MTPGGFGGKGALPISSSAVFGGRGISTGLIGVDLNMSFGIFNLKSELVTSGAAEDSWCSMNGAGVGVVVGATAGGVAGATGITAGVGILGTGIEAIGIGANTGAMGALLGVGDMAISTSLAGIAPIGAYIFSISLRKGSKTLSRTSLAIFVAVCGSRERFSAIVSLRSSMCVRPSITAAIMASAFRSSSGSPTPFMTQAIWTAR